MNAGALLEAAYRGMHDEIVDGIVTGGTVVSSLTDSAIIGKYPDKKFKNWVAFISTTTDGLAPQAEYSVITDNVNSTGVISFGTLTAAPGAGDTYAVCKASVPLNTMVKLCNDALRLLGRIWMIDTSGTTAASTRQYALPVATKGVDLRSVYLRDTNNYHYDAPPYDILPAVGGTATTTLDFRSEPLSPRTIVINYMGYHPALTAFNSAINETIPDELIVKACIERALHWKTVPKRRKQDLANWMDAKQDFEDAKRLYPIQKPQKENRRVPINVYNG